MRKEIVCYIETNEEGEEVSVQRVAGQTDFIQLRIGQIRLVLNKNQLVDAVGTCDMYGKMFDEEAATRENRAKLEESRKIAAKKQEKVAGPTEAELSFVHENRTEPTESELALKKLMEEL